MSIGASMMIIHAHDARADQIADSTLMLHSATCDHRTLQGMPMFWGLEIAPHRSNALLITSTEDTRQL